ncbi:MAG: hypothetical protein ACTHJU_04050 [Sphingopyxis sp.]
MIEQHRPVSTRIRIARRLHWVAAAASILFALTCFVGWPLGYLWPSGIGLAAFLPSIWVFSAKCGNCGWPAFTDYEADEKLQRDERSCTRFWGKEYGGVNLPLSSACTKCGARFV